MNVLFLIGSAVVGIAGSLIDGRMLGPAFLLAIVSYNIAYLIGRAE